MGNVGNIEKVMVFGILLIIISILAIAIWGNNAVDDPQFNADGTLVGGDHNAEALGTPLRRSGSTGTGGSLGNDPGGSTGGGNQAELLSPPSEEELRNSTNQDPPRKEYGVKPTVPEIPAEQPEERGELPRNYTVKDGDSFEKISIRLYGTARYTEDLVKANEDVNPRKMRVGQVLNVPRFDDYAGMDDDGAGATPQDGGTASRNTYIVKKGDTLFGIARDVYGSSKHWNKIYDANRRQLPSQNSLKVGMELVLPPL